MSYVIDLDAVLDEAPTVKWNGEHYPVTDISVEKMLKLSRQAREAEESDAQDEQVWINLREQVRELVPKAPPEFHDSLGLKQMIVFIQAITQDATALGEEGNLKRFIREKGT